MSATVFYAVIAPKWRAPFRPTPGLGTRPLVRLAVGAGSAASVCGRDRGQQLGTRQFSLDVPGRRGRRYDGRERPVMTGPVRCEVTELEVTGCAHCRNTPAPPREVHQLGPWFPARYPGRCSECDDRFHEDDDIRADGEGGYLCTDCGEEAES